MANYPLPKFHFQVEWGGSKLGFTEVSGLAVETDVIEYRDGLSPEYVKTKMPGMQKYGNITIELELRNEQVFNLRFRATSYQDSLFKEAREFEELIQRIVG